VQLSGGTKLTVDHVVLATGYRIQLERGSVSGEGKPPAPAETKNGFPVLDEHFQASILGPFFTSMPAVQDFGPFFAFTVSVRTKARLIGQTLQK
jgi:hypothetical protein